MSKWVQSKYSKDSKKWKVLERHNRYYHVSDNGAIRMLLDDEYIECATPERWETCTREMFFGSPGFPCGPRASAPAVLQPPIGYRWAWSEKDPNALVIQKKVQS